MLAAFLFFAAFGILVLWTRRRFSTVAASSRRVIMLHPDLGIGGAERLVVDAATGLTDLGWSVGIVTNFHDPARAFAETIDGPFSVTVAGGWLPRHIRGRGHVLLASARMTAAAVWVSCCSPPCACFIVDQVAFVVPILRLLTGRPVFFYCHFPDQLCDPNRMTGKLSQSAGLRALPRRMYRALFDFIEVVTMRATSGIAFNSQFTRSVSVATFPFLKDRTNDVEHVLYPPINIAKLIAPPQDDSEAASLRESLEGTVLILSINRFERKKNLGLAVESFARLYRQAPAELRGRLRLVLAGGYDPRLPENVTCFDELTELAEKCGVTHGVTFMRSFTDNAKKVLLQLATVVVYTPTGEHFGIVPVEAMAYGKPVVAVASGGPLESITEDGTVGILCSPTPQSFCAALDTLLISGCDGRAATDLRNAMGSSAQARCNRLYSLGQFAKGLDAALTKMLAL